MAEDNEKRYGVIDHANKLGDRDRVNPNRAARRQVTHRWSEVSPTPASGAFSETDENKPER